MCPYIKIINYLIKTLLINNNIIWFLFITEQLLALMLIDYIKFIENQVSFLNKIILQNKNCVIVICIMYFISI